MDGLVRCSRRVRMRVGYLSEMNPRSRWSWSGGHFSMFRALAGPGTQLVHVGKSLLPIGERVPWPLSTIAYRLSKVRTPELAERWGLTIARAYEREMARLKLDVLFAPLCSFEAIETDLPIAYTSDITFRLWSNYYGAFGQSAPDTLAYLEEAERRRIERADLLIYPSKWAAKSAVEDYGAAPDRVRVVPFGANVADPVSDDEFTKLLSMRQHEKCCRLLFVGMDWVRKGGDLAINTALTLVRRGVPAKLTIVGCTPKLSPNVSPEVVEVIGAVDKNTAKGRRTFDRLFRRAHFLIVPSRAEAYGFVFCEAAAYGLPVLATETGGIPSIVNHGVTGFLLSLDSSEDSYAARVEDMFGAWRVYEQFSRAARRRFETTVNWRAWGETVQTELRALRSEGTRVPE